MEVFLLIYMLTINLISYTAMWKDKLAAKSQNWRISEFNLIALALVGGSIGIYSGTRYPVRHKSSKFIFRYVVPFIIFIQIGAAIYFSSMMN